MRLALVLPATAIKKPIGMGESWRHTGPVKGAILAALLILTCATFAVTYLVDRAIPPGGVRIAVDLIVTWASVMVGVSAMTTLYGLLVEGRRLD
jgi:hypothetical protein